MLWNLTVGKKLLAGFMSIVVFVGLMGYYGVNGTRLEQVDAATKRGGGTR